MTSVVKSLAKIEYAATHPKVDLPELPEETWLDILRFALEMSELNNEPRLLSFPEPLSKKTLRKRVVRSIFFPAR